MINSTQAQFIILYEHTNITIPLYNFISLVVFNYFALT